MSHEPDELRLAELDRRFYALLIDRLIGWGLLALVVWLAYGLGGGRGIALVVCAVLAGWVAVAAMLSQFGATPGKAATALRVQASPGGGRIEMGAALKRTVLLGVAGLPTLGIGLASLAYTATVHEKRRGWHELVSGSVVVDSRPAPEPEAVEERPAEVVNLTAMRLMPEPNRPAEPEPEPMASPVSEREDELPQQAEPEQSVEQLEPRPREPAPVQPVSDEPAKLGGPLAPRRTIRWRVSFDAGEAFDVEGLALVGRSPEPREDENPQHVVTLPSQDRSVSKTHAQFDVVPDGTLVVMDRGSTNGTALVRAGVSRLLSADQPTTLLDGDVVRFGDRTMTVTER